MATWLAPKTFVNGDKLTFAELNTALGPLGSMQWLKDRCVALGLNLDSGTQTLNSALRGGQLFGAQQQIPDSEWTRVQWSEQRVGRSNDRERRYLYDEHAGLFILPIEPDVWEHTGYWLAVAQVTFAGNTVGTRGLRLGFCSDPDFTPTDVIASRTDESVAATSDHSMTISTIIGGPSGGDYEIQGGDAIVAEVYQTSGDNLALVTSSTGPSLWAVYLSPIIALP